MNIIIVGCGKVGEELAHRLNDEGDNITVIDVDSTKVNDVTSRLDVLGVTGNGATHLVQQEAGIRDADLLIAVTGSDELNLLCCLIAKKEGNCQTIARVRDPQYSTEAPYLKEELGLAMVINPEFQAAAEIARVLRFPSAIKIDTFAKGKVDLMKFRLPENCVLTGCSVKEIATKLKCDVLVCTVERGDEAFIPNGEFVFGEKDIISVIASPANANAFFRKIDYKINQVKDCMIAGGGDVAYYLCRILKKAGISLKLIEKDPKRCEMLCTALPEVTVICGDAADQQILLEEGLENANSFAALTNLDEENIMLSLFARVKGCKKLVTKINRIDFFDVIKQLDLDSIIYPKSITSELIVSYVRAMKNTIGSNVQTVYSIIKGKAEAAEFLIKDTSPVLGKPLMELKFKPNVLVAVILRGNKVIIPRGSDVIEKNDSVIVVSDIRPHDISDILD
mgnify:FL=1